MGEHEPIEHTKRRRTGQTRPNGPFRGKVRRSTAAIVMTVVVAIGAFVGVLHGPAAVRDSAYQGVLCAATRADQALGRSYRRQSDSALAAGNACVVVDLADGSAGPRGRP